MEGPFEVVFLLVKYNLGKFHSAAYQDTRPRPRVQHVTFIIITLPPPPRVCVVYNILRFFCGFTSNVFFFFGYSTFLFRSNVRVRWTAGTVYTVYNICIFIYEGIMSSLTVRNVQINAMLWNVVFRL